MQIRLEQSEVYHRHDLAIPGLVLNLTADPWVLNPEREAPVFIGRDVVHPGVIGPDGGRRSIGVSIPVADRPITDAWARDRLVRTGIRYRDTIHNIKRQAGSSGVAGTYDDSGNGFGEHTLTDVGGFSGVVAGDWAFVNAPATHRGQWAIVLEKGADDVRFDRSLGVDVGSDAMLVMFYSPVGYMYFYKSFGSGGKAYNLLVKSPAEYLLTGPWPDGVVGYKLVVNGDGRVLATDDAEIESISTSISKNDTINMTPEVEFTSLSDTTRPGEDKFYILYKSDVDARGVWVTNGRKFWLLQDSVYTLWLDLGSDDFLGARWNINYVAPQLLMMTSDKYPPRILHIGGGPIIGPPDDASIAGLFAPKKRDPIETDGDDDGNANKSWYGAPYARSGSMSVSSSYRIKVRAINIDDGAESQFVNVYYGGDRDDRDIPTGASDNVIAVRSQLFSGIEHVPAPLSSRWTHIEIWRTIDAGADYFLERRVEIASLENELDGTYTTTQFDCLIEDDPAVQETCTLSDTDLATLTIMTTSDLLAGLPPPICRRVISLGGVTICAGKAHPDAVDPTFYNRNYYVDAADGDYAVATKRITGAANTFLQYIFVDGDQFVVLFPLAHAGVYDIESRNDANSIDLEEDIGRGDLTNELSGYIRRATVVDWPKIERDEDIWYSRTDKFRPESFQIINTDGSSRILTLSEIGDTFRHMIKVGNYVAVIMDQGVHLLYFSGTTLTLDTISSFGDGTPWGDSVVVVGNTVIWAGTDGFRQMSTSNAVDQAGHRGQISSLDGGRMRAWCEEALEKGYPIDAGVDSVAKTVRFRRCIDENTYEVLQYSYQTGLWTQIEDDNGIRYVGSTSAAADQMHVEMFSVTPEGALFAVNHYDKSHPYDAVTVQAPLDDTYSHTFVKIRRPGAFSPAMIGDIVRFRSDNDAVDGLARVITSATADEIVFGLVDGLADGDEFIIGAVRYRVRYAPLYGSEKGSVKTLHDVMVRALPGPRNSPGGNWPDPPDGRLSLRSYAEHGGTPRDRQELSVRVFDDDDVERTTDDRVSSLAGDGTSLSIEIECIETRTDFRMELLQVTLREEASQKADTSVEA